MSCCKFLHAQRSYAKILSVCITYYAGGLERKRSVYERAVDPVLIPATIMAFVEKGEEGLNSVLFAGIPAIYAMFNDFRRYEIYDFYDKKHFCPGYTRKYDNHRVNFAFLCDFLRNK